MQEKQIKHLLSNARKALRQGGRIIVAGWKGSNHNKTTQQLERTGKVIFITGSRAKEVGDPTDLVILTRFVSHSQIAGMQSNDLNVYPHAVSMGVIRQILNDCKNLISISTPDAPADTDDVAAQQQESESLDDLERFIVTTEKNVDAIDKFAARFAEEANAHPEELVGSRTLGKILQELELREKPVDLVKSGYLEAITLEGKSKIGWYKAAPKLIERLNTHIGEEPEDPIEKAEYLLAQEPAIQEKLEEAREVVAYWETQANRVEKAKELLKQLSEI